MALCVPLNPDGTLTPTGQPAAECTGYMLITPGEQAWTAMLADVFAYPDPAEALLLAVQAFGGVLTFYVLGYICGAIGRYFD